MTSLGEITRLAMANFELMLDAVPDPMIMTDVEGAVLRLSKSAAHLLGYDPADLEGRPLAQLISAELRDDYDRHRVSFLNSGAETAPELETRFVTADRSTFPIDASVGRLDLNGTTYLLVVMREVSDRLATQDRLERMVAIDELTTSISSRLNIPDSDAIKQAAEVSIHELAAFCDASSAYLFTEGETGSFVLHSKSGGDEGHGGLMALGPTRSLGSEASSRSHRSRR